MEMPTLSVPRKMQTKTVMRSSSWGEAQRAPGLQNSPQMVLSDPGPFSGARGPDLPGPVESEWDPCPFPSCSHQKG